MNEMMDSKNRIWLLLSKKISRSISFEESIELEKLLQHDPDAWYTLEVLNAIGEIENIPPELVDEIQSLLQGNHRENNDDYPVTRPASKRNSPKWAKVSLIACIFLAVIMVGGYYLRLNIAIAPVSSVSAFHEISVSKGSQTSHTLPDGTKIRLNAGSTITYPKNYATAPSREIHLVGEAYFDVAHDKQRPFAVHTPAFTIRNLGTAFNVKAYPGDPTIEATLIEGSIEVVFHDKPNESIVMKPQEKIIFYNDGLATDDAILERTATSPNKEYQLSTIIPDTKSNEIAETAWMDNKIIFKNETFRELAKKLERRFNVDIVIQNDDVLICSLTGSFEQENLAESLETLQLICAFEYSIKDNVVYITR